MALDKALAAKLENEDKLSDGEHQVLIDYVIAHRNEIEKPNLTVDMKGFVDFLLGCHMNEECLKCALGKWNGGKCYSKSGGNPCLIFKKREENKSEQS